MIELQTAIELKEAADRAGVELPASLMTHQRWDGGWVIRSAAPGDKPVPEDFNEFPAYTTDELLDLLPAVVRIDDHSCYLKLEKCDDGSGYISLMKGSYAESELFFKERPSEALAQLAIYLINNDYIK